MFEPKEDTMTATKTILTLVAAIATAALFTSSAAAMARADNGATGTPQEYEWVSNGYGGVKAVPLERVSEIPYLSHGHGITREAPSESTSTPIFRDAPDGLLPRGQEAQVSVASTGLSVDWSEIALAVAFGLLLAMLGAVGALSLRQRTLRTQ